MSFLSRLVTFWQLEQKRKLGLGLSLNESVLAETLGQTLEHRPGLGQRRLRLTLRFSGCDQAPEYVSIDARGVVLLAARVPKREGQRAAIRLHHGGSREVFLFQGQMGHLEGKFVRCQFLDKPVVLRRGSRSRLPKAVRLLERKLQAA